MGRFSIGTWIGAAALAVTLVAPSVCSAQIIATGTRNGELTPTATTPNNATFASWTASGVSASASGGQAGGYAILDNSTDTLRTSTTFTLASAGSLLLNFWLKTEVNNQSGNVIASLLNGSNSSVVQQFTRTSGLSSSTWGAVSQVTFSNVAAGTYFLQFQRQQGTADTGIDTVDLTFAAVPAPLAGAGMLSLAFGVGAAGLFRRRRVSSAS